MKTFCSKKVFCVNLQTNLSETMSESSCTSTRQALHDHIIEVADEQFRKHGIRSVRMDDLAALLGISKRTLYQEFSDKEAVLVAISARNKHVMDEAFRKYEQESENVLELMLNMVRFTIKVFSTTNPKYFEEMHRYPLFKEEVEKSKVAHREKMRCFFLKGIEQGIFRESMNVEMFLDLQQVIQDHAVHSLTQKYGAVETLRNSMLTGIRGVSTLKGIEMIDAFLEEIKNEKG